MSTADSATPKSQSYAVNGGGHYQGTLTPSRNSGSDSAVDSTHSYCDEAASCGEHARGSHSSESSGKYSLRESIASLGDCSHSSPGPATVSPVGMMQSFHADATEEARKARQGHAASQDALQPLQDASGPRKASRGSSCSERGSISSVSSVTAVLRDHLGRSISLKVRRPRAGSATVFHGSPALAAAQPPRRRAVSLRLPRSHRRPHDADTNLPTIYIEDSPRAKGHVREYRRKSSLRRALSLLSINSLRQEALGHHHKSQKPVQKILRQPRRRHTTVRGLSGMAIDEANQPGVQGCNTLYYPTATSMRHAYAARRTYSDHQS